jgi:hypothetical protein
MINHQKKRLSVIPADKQKNSQTHKRQLKILSCLFN